MNDLWLDSNSIGTNANSISHRVQLYIKDLLMGDEIIMMRLMKVGLGNGFSYSNLLCKHKTLNILNGKSKAWSTLNMKGIEIIKSVMKLSIWHQQRRPTKWNSTNSLRNRNFCGSESAGKARCSLTQRWLGFQAWKKGNPLLPHENLSTSQQLELHILQWYDLELFRSCSSQKNLYRKNVQNYQRINYDSKDEDVEKIPLVSCSFSSC